MPTRSPATRISNPQLVPVALSPCFARACFFEMAQGGSPGPLAGIDFSESYRRLAKISYRIEKSAPEGEGPHQCWRLGSHSRKVPLLRAPCVHGPLLAGYHSLTATLRGLASTFVRHLGDNMAGGQPSRTSGQRRDCYWYEAAACRCSWPLAWFCLPRW